jgi:predicted ester cyclase
MTSELNKALVRRFFESLGANDQATLNELLSADLVAHMPGMPGPLSRELMLQGASASSAAFSDQHYTVEDQIAEDDKVTTRTTWQATHSAGDFQGVSPTGKRVAASGISIERIQGGKIVERWLCYDQIGMMQQLGLIPPPQANQ